MCVCVSSLRVLCRQLKGNLFKTYSHCKMWIIFQHQTSELQKLGVQLDNVAKKADAATRERCIQNTRSWPIVRAQLSRKHLNVMNLLQITLTAGISIASSIMMFVLFWMKWKVNCRDTLISHVMTCQCYGSSWETARMLVISCMLRCHTSMMP